MIDARVVQRFQFGVGTDVRDARTGRRIDGWPRAERWDNASIRELLAEYAELKPQPSELQSEFKISYYGYNLSPSFLRSLSSALNRRGYAVEIVYSSDRDLDVLPQGVNKGTAAAFLADFFGLSRDEVLVSGDSGNDLAMFVQGFRGIVVANAHSELKSLNNPRVYHSPHAYAAGVLDGLQHWLAKVPA